MLMGEFHHNLDEKGRIIIPSKFREELGNNIIITRGIDECLFIYSLKEWAVIVSKLKMLPFTREDARNFNRIFLSGAVSASFDKQGRIGITAPLKDYALLDKDCVIIGVNDRLELWSSEKWNQFLEKGKETLSELANHLFEGEFE